MSGGSFRWVGFGLLAALACGEQAAAPGAPAPTTGSAGAAARGGGGAGGAAGSPSAAGHAGADSQGGTSGEEGGGALAGSAGALGGAGHAGAGMSGAGAGAGAPPAPQAMLLGETQLPGAGLTIVSYGGYLNGESFQQDGIVTHKGYQYAAYWNSARHVVLARRALPSGAWASVELTDYTNTEDDAHNTISLGVAPADGTLHVAFDHHGSPLHYRRSQLGLLDDPAQAEWKASSFGPVQGNLVSGVNLTQVTYPRFVTEPDGKKLLLSARLGESGAGDEQLWEYDAGSHTWQAVGKYIDGITDSVNAYLHGIAYAPGSRRLHAAWCWRDTPNASTNRDLLYIYSDDHGRTWNDNAGTLVATSGSQPIRRATAGIAVVSIGQNRGLINQEHLAVDAAGRVHVLLSHLPDSAANDSNFDSARQKSEYFHYFRDEAGKWKRTALGQKAVAAFRGKLAFSSSGNAYAVLPNLRIVGSAAGASFAEWQLLISATTGRFFSDPLIDAARLRDDGVLSVMYPAAQSPDLFVIDYEVE